MAKSFNARMKARLTVISSNAAKLNTYIHETAMQILAHAQEHGDCTFALKLTLAMPASMRRTMLIKWFETFSPVTVKLPGTGNPDGKVGINKGKNAKPFDLEGAAATPFYELAEQEPEDKVYTLAELIKMVQGLGKRIEGKIDKGEVGDNDRDAARALVSKIEGVIAA